ncbi:hypothetical protein B0H13DRAFT_2415558 [Mycena leptocephala]|nr:hypothetical protein B0H13DRAFT_2415558 [Mycena leptocephala]
MVEASQFLGHCPPPSRNFQGRRMILDKMHQLFDQGTNKQNIYVLYGPGGAGKTQIALKFIEESTCFGDQLLVDASTTETIETGLKNFANAKKIGSMLRSHIEVVWRIQILEDMVIILRFLPANEQFAVEIVKPSQELYYLPLAIVQAGAFILKSEALGGYLALHRTNRLKLLSEEPAQSYDGYALSVFTSWQMSFDKLSQPAAMLLQFCSFLHRDGIAEDIFRRASCSKALDRLVNPVINILLVKSVKVTNEIKAYSLINFNEERKSFSIHPLVHEWSRTALADPDSAHSCMDAAKLEVNVLEKRRKLLGDDHLDSLQAMHSLAVTCKGLGQFQEAKKLLLVVLEKRRQRIYMKFT